MTRLAIAVFGATMLSLSACHAAGDKFPLGLEKLRWDMTRAEVNVLFPLHAYTPPPSSPPMPPGETALKSEVYAWQPCGFGGIWRFNKTGLHAITLTDAQGSRACAEAILAALRARYGEGSMTTDRFGVDRYEWKSADTIVKFFWMGELGSFVWLAKPSDEAAQAKP